MRRCERLASDDKKREGDEFSAAAEVGIPLSDQDNNEAELT